LFRRILIANRGEVAARVLRTCRRLGVEVVAVASEADREAAWLADAAVVATLGGPRPAQSYLDPDALIEVALHHRCAAVHPGWGFLSENAEFATKVAAAGLTFIGPAPRHLRVMGDKAEARRTMGDLGLPLIPGTGALSSIEEAQEAAARFGYPVLLKAVAGGGGRGMRGVEDPADLPAAFREASAEALSAFGDGRMYLEKRIVRGRHVEVQVIADRFGHCVHLGERECSLQRRHQKVVEEAPSPGLSPSERARILPLVAEAVGRAGYRNAGTIEMLLDETGQLYFMEMNTRLQVEHPISEETTGIDLVEWQLLVAAGHRLPRTQDQITSSGHAIELRINAEDPDQNFRPSPGRITKLRWPEGEGIRVDTHLREGDAIPPYYDSMVGKLIARGPSRADAIERLRGALGQLVIEGVTTNVALHQRILSWDAFLQGAYDTRSLETFVLARS
jgi:acetyl-CoA carboxylase, biotin carboxylase subunit